jgi:hypothetical protein
MNSKSVVVLAAIAFLSAVIGDVAVAEEEVREVSAFDAILFAGPGDLKITVGEERSVVLQGDQRLLEEIETEVKGGRLFIKRENQSWFSFGRKNYGRLKVRVSMPELDEATLAGSGDLDVEGLDGGETELVIAGSGDIKAQGKLEFIRLVINGSGEIEARDLEAENADVTINGSGEVVVKVSGDLDATINGSGDIEYIGEPKNIRKSVRGSGDIRRR